MANRIGGDEHLAPDGNAAHEEDHAFRQGAHHPEPLEILRRLAWFSAVDAVPVLTGGNRHPGNGEVFVQLVKGGGQTAAASRCNCRTDLHALIKARAVKQPVKAGDKRRVGRRIVNGARDHKIESNANCFANQCLKSQRGAEKNSVFGNSHLQSTHVKVPGKLGTPPSNLGAFCILRVSPFSVF